MWSGGFCGWVEIWMDELCHTCVQLVQESLLPCGGTPVVVRRCCHLLWWWLAGKVAGNAISSFSFLSSILQGLQWQRLPKVNLCNLQCLATVDFLSSSRKCAQKWSKCTFLCRITSTHIINLETWKHTLNATKGLQSHLIPVIRNAICTINKGKSGGKIIDEQFNLERK